MTYEESKDEAISSSFQRAIVKYDKAESQVKETKKQIIVDLAKELEKLLPIDTISIEIATQLRGRASSRFIRECLDEKVQTKTSCKKCTKTKEQENEYRGI